MNTNATENSGAANRVSMNAALTQATQRMQKKSVDQPDIDALKAAVLAYVPPKKHTAIDVVRELFPVLEEKRKDGASYEGLAELLSGKGWETSVHTLKTLMSNVRREMKTVYVSCPHCGTKVPEALIAKDHASTVHDSEGDSTA